jgi:hypothetical protein
LEQLHSVCFVNSDTGWVVGSQGTIMTTVDGGLNWKEQTSPTTNMLLSVCFISPQVGWAVGWYGTVLKTTNAGGLWEIQDSGIENHLTSVFFVDEHLGWAVGWNGTILKSEDGGLHWISQCAGTDEWLYSAAFTGSDIGWVVGTEGVILKTTTGGEIGTFCSGGGNDTLASLVFMPNWPNPFNASTSFRFGLPCPTRVSFQVFDIRGRQVAVLAEGHLEAGEHTVTWRPDQTPSGIYLYRFQAGKDIRTGKMVVQK